MMGFKVGEPLPGFPKDQATVLDVLGTGKTPGFRERDARLAAFAFTEKPGDPSISVASILGMPAFDGYRVPLSSVPNAISMGIYPS
jgi:hypothetical protein